MEKNSKIIFFLGGKDLEMETIQNLLEQNNIEFVNKNLSWGEASIGQYLSQIKEKITEGYIVYGIELANPENIVIDNYFSIDHHGIYEGNPSSLEQVCNIIKHNMSHEEQLIAANDARYISGMKNLGASDDEIKDIRSRDRKAQGVTEKEEKKAEAELDHHLREDGACPGYYFIKTELKHFSPLVDQIFMSRNVKRLLVYSETEFTIYGYRKDSVLKNLRESAIHISGLYWGGGEKGFLGGYFDGEKEDNVNQLISLCKPYSKHFFLFPFSCKDIEFKSFHNSEYWKKEDGNLKRVPLDKEKLDGDLYNELNFFFPHLYNILYDSGEDSCIRHYEYDGASKDGNLYVIQKDESKKYELDIESVNINFYSTGVGVVSIGASNAYYGTTQDILNINQFGRRLFHPFAYDSISNDEGARSLSLILSGENIELMNNDVTKANSISSGLTGLINKVIKDQTREIQPILDDRMFVMSWYRNDELKFSSLTDYRNFKKGSREYDHFWYKYVFVDGSFPTCQNAEMMSTLLNGATYPRWQEFGTLYGISRYSFVLLTSSSCPEYLLKYFETEYVKMAELALVQRASILKYTKALQECTNTEKEFMDTKKLSVYYKEYLHFLNNYRFTNISAQDQAIELYDMLCDKIHIKEDSDLLDRQFNEVQEFMELEEERSANKEARVLNFLAGCAVPIAITSAIFGFFFHDSFGTEKNSDFNFEISALWTNPGVAWLILTIILTILLVISFNRKRTK